MTEEAARKVIVDRADRMLRQSRMLRRLSDELHQESKDLRKTARASTAKRTGGRKKR